MLNIKLLKIILLSIQNGNFFDKFKVIKEINRDFMMVKLNSFQDLKLFNN